jgi:hypothetical protein
MSDDVRRLITAWPVIVFVLAAAVGYGVLVQTVRSQGDEINKLRSLPERITNIESDVRWLRDYFEPRNPRR